jgi:phosphatidylglycerophosphate synthase
MKKMFNGGKKKQDSITLKFEKQFVKWIVPKIPLWIKSYHLTLSSIVWSALIILSGFLSIQNINWLWLNSFAILMHTLTDAIDGSLGKYRKEGLIKWGYYMDHFFDYIFLCSVLIGYSFSVSEHFKYMLFFILSIFGAYMINTYLTFPLTNRFINSYLHIGPTEIKILFVVINTLLIIFGRTYMATVLPYVLILSFIGLCVVIYKTQKELMDTDRKNNVDKN